MRYAIDTEFHDRGHNQIDLLSVGVYAEDGSSYYAVVKEADWKAVATNDWLMRNVYPVLPDPRSRSLITPYKRRDTIRTELLEMFSKDTQPQFWAYFADWDWMLFIHLFGTLLDGPPNFPMLCLDIKQEMMRLQIPKESLTGQSTSEHNALNDAEWNMQILREIAVREKRQYGSTWLER